MDECISLWYNQCVYSYWVYGDKNLEKGGFYIIIQYLSDYSCCVSDSELHYCIIATIFIISLSTVEVKYLCCIE